MRTFLDVTTRAELIACKRPVFTNVQARGQTDAEAVGVAIFTVEALEASEIILSKLA